MGSSGSSSHAQIFNRRDLREKFENGTLGLPPPELLNYWGGGGGGGGGGALPLP